VLPVRSVFLEKTNDQVAGQIENDQDGGTELLTQVAAAQAGPTGD